ncbi:hypothetical protein [Niveispirillum fermenti]|uniref:hypothetical protein n=1 Tax=Niveispirillum fermenti TaxID=1233113 RepID=UPI003A88F650
MLAAVTVPYLQPDDGPLAPAAVLRMQANRAARHRQRLAELRPLERLDWLVFTRDVEYYTEVEGKPFATILDPIALRLITAGRGRKVRLFPGGPCHVPATILDHNPSQQVLLAREFTAHGGWGPDMAIPELAELCAAAERLAPGLKLRTEHLLGPIWIMWSHYRHFLEVLRILRPRAVMVMCHHAPPVMGLLAAAWRLGIPSVDVQHGMQGRYHPANTHHSRLPAGGFNTMPSYFWQWGRHFAEQIEAWSPLGTHWHKTFIGIHPWISHLAQSGWDNVEAPWKQALSGFERYPVRIAVSLQSRIYDQPIPGHLLETMRRAPADWLWLIRNHPMTEESPEQISAMLNAAGIPNHDTAAATAMPLAVLLRHATHHLTPFSSAVYEAALFGLPSVVIDSRARSYLPDLLERNVAVLETTPDAILERLRHAKRIQAGDLFGTGPLTLDEVLTRLDRTVLDDGGA